MDDELWNLVWERRMSHPERHGVARTVWFRRVPDDPFEARVATELNRRWRRRCWGLALLYLVWTMFWGLLTVEFLRDPPMVDPPLPVWNTVFGLAAVAACVAARWRLSHGPQAEMIRLSRRTRRAGRHSTDVRDHRPDVGPM